MNECLMPIHRQTRRQNHRQHRHLQFGAVRYLHAAENLMDCQLIKIKLIGIIFFFKLKTKIIFLLT